MSTPLIAAFLMDDENVDEFAAHGLWEWQVHEVLDNRYIIGRNRRGRRSRLLIVGQDNGGAYITIPVEPTHDPLLWRPVTAWPSKEHEKAKLRREGAHR